MNSDGSGGHAHDERPLAGPGSRFGPLTARGSRFSGSAPSDDQAEVWVINADVSHPALVASGSSFNNGFLAWRP